MTEIRSARFIGAKIKARRKALGISQEKLAEALNVSYQQVQRYENGLNLLNVEKIQVIAQYLDLPVNYFFGEEEGSIAEPAFPYLSSEETKLLRLFRKVRNKYKNAIFQFMELASKK